jgi:2-oxoglutarate dehydrogenase E2 component (dihydrolipoamide succinyltransferase)
MKEVKVPSPGESVSTVIIASWLVADGDFVEKNQDIAEIDSDKATLSITAEVSGTLSILVAEGSQAAVGEVIARIRPEESKGDSIAESAEATKGTRNRDAEPEERQQHDEGKDDRTTGVEGEVSGDQDVQQESDTWGLPLSPLARAFMDAGGLTEKEVMTRLQNYRIKKRDLELLFQDDESLKEIETGMEPTVRQDRREPMTPLRMKLSQRLVSVKNETAMLTTFNEVDMHALLSLRSQYGKPFQEKHGVKLGLMAFFARAVTLALIEFPTVNASIEGDDVVYHEYVDISIAVSSPKGLVVPVVRNAHQLTLAETEAEIQRLAEKARNSRLSLDEMTGGTFTITNGGVFGSMLSTPILNPPQSAILGMHNITDRPVAVNGKVEIRSMMYVALSYDHRLIDGRESVGFLKRVKELIENPLMMTGTENPYQKLLGL